MDDGTTLLSPPLTGSQWIARASARPVSPDADVVRWQSSESQNPALQALIKEAETSVYLPPDSATSLSQRIEAGISGLRKYDTEPDIQSGGSRYPSKPRRRQASASRLSSSATPLSPSLQGDTTNFLDLIKTVSGHMDKTERLKRQRYARQPQQQNHSLSDITSRRNVRETPSLSSIQTSTPVNKGKAPVTSRWTLPNIDLSCGSIDKDVSMDVDSSNDLPVFKAQHKPNDSGNQSVAGPSRPKVSRESSSSMISHNSSQDCSIPRHRVSPPLQDSRDHSTTSSLSSQKRKAPPNSPSPRRVRPPSPNPEILLSQDAPRSSPSASQMTMTQRSARPPVLGMRRVINSNTVSPFVPSQNIPHRQKAFRPPLMAKPAANTIAYNTASNTTVSTQVQPSRRVSLPTPDLTPYERSGGISMTQSESVQPLERSPSPATEANSSFGDISFDLDALEETMRAYD